MKPETILLDALKKIKKECASDYAIDIATKALSDWASAPKEGLYDLTDYGKAVQMAKRFHELYEEYAPLYGYETRKETRDFNEDSPNGKLMIAVCEQLQLSPAPESGQNENMTWVKEKIERMITMYDKGGLAQLKKVIELINISPSSAPESGGEKPMTVAQKVVMDLRIAKLKEMGGTEADILLMEMVELNKKLYGQILDSNIAYHFNQLAKKAIAFDNRPESGGEENQDNLWKEVESILYDTEDLGFPFDEFKSKFRLSKKDFVPSVQSSDVTPVASHSSTSSNSIEEEPMIVRVAKAADEYGRNSNFYKSPIVDKIIAFKEGASFVLNQGENLERSVATKSNQGDDAGNQTSLSKEEGKDDIKPLSRDKEMEIRYKQIDILCAEIERLNRLLKIWFYKAHNYMETSSRRDEVWQQFAKENGLKGE